MKKYIVGAVLSLGILISPTFTQAAGLTNTQVQSILTLLSVFGADSATIANVNAALTGGTPTTGGGFCHTLNTDLTFGSSGDGVLALHKALIKENLLASYYIDANNFEGANSFGESTAAAVVQFQAKYGIRQTGYVGPITRAKLNALYGCSNQQIQPTTWTTPTIQTVSILYPTAGMTFTQGQPMTISWQSIGSSNAKYEVLVQNHDVNMSAGTFSPVQAHCDAADKCYVTWAPTTFANSPVVVQVTDISTFPGASGTSGSFSIVPSTTTTITTTTATYLPGCTSYIGYSSTTGNACNAGTTATTTTASAPIVGSLAYLQTQSSYTAGQIINFQVNARALDGSAANPERGFNVQSSMRMLDPIEKYKAVMVNGKYQSFNAVYSPNTKNWVITMTLPSDTTKTYNIDTAVYCSNSSLGCAQGQINKQFEFTITGTGTAPPASSAPTATITGSLTIPTNMPLVISGVGAPTGSSVNVAISNSAGNIITGSNVIQSDGKWVINFGSNTQIGVGSYSVTVRSYPSMTTLTTGTLNVTAPTTL